MAELEVVKHTRKVYRLWKSPNATMKHKIWETLLEIGIIVFAITLSLWLHNWSEHRHQRAEARAFLTGLRRDLVADEKEMGSDLESYQKTGAGFAYFSRVNGGVAVETDSIRKYWGRLYNTTRLNVNSSRFEGLKASGKIDIIENEELLNAILSFYQEDLTQLDYLNEGFNDFKRTQLQPFVDAHLVRDSSGVNGNWAEMLRAPQARNLLDHGDDIPEIISQYQRAMQKNRNLVALIDKEL